MVGAMSHRQSNIPVPPSALKKSANGMRMSMGGQALRGPMPGTNPRQSMFRSQNVNPLLQSVSKAHIGRTPMKSSMRRGSTWTGTAGNGVSGNPPMKDPRPLRDRAFQQKLRQEILAWLHETGYDISPQALASITGKDFRTIFEHLVGQLDPNFPFDPLRRLEEQFIPALECLHYPFVKGLDSKWLAAPASMYSWPGLLGVLHWLVDLCKAKWHYTSSGDPSLQDVNDVPEQFDSEDHHMALAFQYLDTAYQLYLEGLDAFPEQDKVLEDYYVKKNSKVLEDLERRKTQLKIIKEEYERLKESAPPLEKLLVDSESVKRDEKKLQEMLRHRESRKNNLEASIREEEDKIAAGVKNLDKLRAEAVKYEEIIQVQNLSPEEVMRMNTEHETLSRNLEDLRQRLSETHKTIGFLEPTATNRISEAEEALDAYTNLLDSLSLFPPLPSPLPDVDLRMGLNPAASNPSEILLGQDVRKVIKPTLSRIAEMRMKQRAEVETERIGIENTLDVETVEYENIDEEVAELEKKVMGLIDEADNIRDAAQQEALISNAEASRLQENLVQAKAAAFSSGVGVKTRLQGLQIAYTEQVEAVNRLKEETVRAILKNCNDIGAFKNEVESRLNALKEYAEMN